MVTSRISAASVLAAAEARRLGTSHGTPGTEGSQSNAPAPKTQLYTGMKIALPVGTVQLRSTEFPNVPAKYQTGPLWPSPQNSPVASVRGFRSAGTLMAHCHQRAVHSPYEWP